MKPSNNPMLVLLAWAVRLFLLFIAPLYLLAASVLPWLEAADLWAAEVVKDGFVKKEVSG